MTTSRAPSPIFVAIALATAPASLAQADWLRVRDGGRMEGEASEADAQVVLSTAYGRIVLAEGAVDGVDSERPAVAEYRRRTPTVANRPEAQLAHAKWCRDNGLRDESRRHLRHVLARDPNHEEARRLLGYQLVGGEWLTRDDLLAARGLVRWRGEYRTPQEVALLESRAAEESQRVAWRQRLKRLTAELGSRDPRRARAAEEQITAIRDPAAADELTKRYQNASDPEARRLLIATLAGLDGSVAIPVLANAALKDPDEETRALAIEALAEQPTRGILVGFLAALSSNDNALVNRAGDALSQLGSQEAIPRLIEALVTTHRRQEGPPAEATTYSFAPGSGQYGFGGGGPRVVKQARRNPGVLGALVVLTDVNFLYDQHRWREWWRSTRATPLANLRRDN